MGSVRLEKETQTLFLPLLMMLVVDIDAREAETSTHLIAVAPELAKFSKQIHLYRQCT